nr:hypothetical protein [Trichoderma harzianum]
MYGRLFLSALPLVGPRSGQSKSFRCGGDEGQGSLLGRLRIVKGKMSLIWGTLADPAIPVSGLVGATVGERADLLESRQKAAVNKKRLTCMVLSFEGRGRGVEWEFVLFRLVW